VAGLLCGGLLSAVALYLLSGLFAPLPAAWRRGTVVLVALLGLLRELGVVPVRLPQNTRQVPQQVLQRNPVRGALQFGFELGTGVRTYLSASAPYVLAAAILLAAQPLHVAALAGLGFGSGRATTTLLFTASRSGSEWTARLQSRISVITATGCAAILAAFAVLFR
jgi:hypothetical protein